MNEGLITKGNWDTFLTLAGEKLLLVQRRHIYVILFPIILTSLLFVIFLFAGTYFFTQIFYSIPLLIITLLLFFSIGLSIITKLIVDWYFHLYILTTRKMQEVWYTPLASHTKNEILLDKVNCTEIDLKVDGFTNELIGMGDVIITFDRPTHEQEFVLKDVGRPEIIEKFLTQRLMDHQTKDALSPMWFRRGKR